MKHPYTLPANVATVIAQICCFQNQLPQGAPTSPIISNMICSKLDSELQTLAKINLCRYSRYADDITFTISLSNFPHDLAALEKNSLGSEIVPGDELKAILKHNGFSINRDKFRLQVAGRRQQITGIIVNRFPNVPRSYIRQIRAMLRAWNKFGYEEAEAEHLEKYRQPALDSAPLPTYRQVLRGKITYVGMIRGKQDKLFRKLLKSYNDLAFPDRKEHSEYNTSSGVFISYSRTEKDLIHPVVEKLKLNGVNVWIDEGELEGSKDWIEDIENALNNCSVMILFLSDDALNSHHVGREWKFYYSQNKPIIPVRVKSFKPHSIWDSQYQYTDMYNVDFPELINGLMRQLSRYNVVLNPPPD